MKNFSFPSLKKYILSYIITFFITLIFLAAVSIVFSFFPPYVWLIDTVHDYSLVLSAFIAAFMCARSCSGRGLFNGIIAADIYIALLIALGGLVFKSSVLSHSLIKIFLLSSISGAIGGIWGINSK